MVNKWISNLKCKYDEEALQEEAQKIGAEIDTTNFCAFFTKKAESTESSPSGRHMGHYKVAAHNSTLTDLHTQMINIGLLTGVALDRWRKQPL